MNFCTCVSASNQILHTCCMVYSFCIDWPSFVDLSTFRPIYTVGSGSLLAAAADHFVVVDHFPAVAVDRGPVGVVVDDVVAVVVAGHYTVGCTA